MTVEWMEYPLSIGTEQETMTITWSDGSTDAIPAHDGDGETIFQLPRFMEEIFKVENFNCLEGATAKFVDQYPTLFRSTSGVLVLRVTSEESFLNAFVCKSKDPAECLLSWLNGDIIQFLDQDYPPEGSTDLHWVSTKEVISMLGSGLLNDFPPIVFDLDEEAKTDHALPQTFGFEKVDLPWWYPPSRQGPTFAYPACFFQPESYIGTPTIEQTTSIAIGMTHQLDQTSWLRIVEGATTGSIAERILNNIDHHADRFEDLTEMAHVLGPLWLERWWNFH